MTARRTKIWAALAIIGMVTVSPHVSLAQDGAAGEQPSVYERLGGLAPISVVVSDFIDALVPDPVLNANPAIDAARRRVPAPYLKYHLTAMVCQATGGPCQYQGRAMKESHTHLNITEQEWDRMAAIFSEVLAKHGVPEKETGELFEIIGTTKADIVIAAGGK
jgi:hemoglobin